MCSLMTLNTKEPLINYMMLLAYRLIRDPGMTLKAGWPPVEKS